MMHRTDHFRYAEGDAWQAIELPYVGELLSLVVVVPVDGSSDADALAAIPTIATAAHSERVAVSLPRFDAAFQVDLRDALGSLGMPAAFAPDHADFSAMAEPGVDRLCLAAVAHAAIITVDETGTDAVSATAVMAEPGSAAGDQPIQFVVDRPFLFALRDNPTGAVLLAGRIGDPTLARQEPVARGRTRG
jgi:serpin B